MAKKPIENDVPLDGDIPPPPPLYRSITFRGPDTAARAAARARQDAALDAYRRGDISRDEARLRANAAERSKHGGGDDVKTVDEKTERVITKALTKFGIYDALSPTCKGNKYDWDRNHGDDHDGANPGLSVPMVPAAA